MCFIITVCFVFVSHADEINSQRSSGGVVEMFWVFFFSSRVCDFFFFFFSFLTDALAILICLRAEVLQDIDFK